MRRTNFGGRPAIREPEQGRRVNVNFGIPLPLKRQVEKAAKERGWSISLEGAYRLQTSFDRETGLGSIGARGLADSIVAAFMHGARRQAQIDGHKTLPKEWERDPSLFDAAAREVWELLERYRHDTFGQRKVSRSSKMRFMED